MQKRIGILIFILFVIGISGYVIYRNTCDQCIDDAVNNGLESANANVNEAIVQPPIAVKRANLHDEVTLTEGETVEVANEDLWITLKSIGFVSPPTQDGYTAAVEPSVRIFFDIVHKNKLYTNFNDTVYHYELVDRDDDTSVTIKVQTREQLCSEWKTNYPNSDGFNSCWFTLAKNAQNAEYCKNIEAATTRKQCDDYFASL